MADRNMNIGTLKDYETIILWEASTNRTTQAGNETGILTDNKDYAEHHIVLDDGYGGSSYRLKLTANDDVMHDGTARNGARSKTPGTPNYIIRMNGDYITVEKLGLENTRTVERSVVESVIGGPKGHLVQRCVIVGGGLELAGTNVSAGLYCNGSVGEIVYQNNVIFACNIGVRIRSNGSGADIKVNYNSVEGNTTGISSNETGTTGTTEAWGNVSLGNTDDWLGNFWDDGDYNISGLANDANCPGTNSDEGNETAAGFFVDVSTVYDPDLTKKSSKDGTLDGGPSTGLGSFWVDEDIFANARSDYDIGAYELAGGATPGNIMLQVITA